MPKNHHPAPLPPDGLLARVVDYLTRRRIRISIIVICALIAKDMVLKHIPHNLFDLGDAWTVIGLLLVLGGVFFRSWAAGVLEKNASLTTSGPYAITRNPLYFGTFLMMIGYSSIVGVILNFVALFLLAILLYLPKITREEAYLSEEFGDEWTAYANSTPRLVPHGLSGQKIFGCWSFKQWLRNEEYQAIAGVSLALVTLAVWFKVTIALS